MANNASAESPAWIVLLIRLPTEPARHRMAVWRELRRSGAVLVGSSAWALPSVTGTQPLLKRVRTLVDRAQGSLVALAAVGNDDVDSAALMLRYEAARRDEWDEFIADCGKYQHELDKETRIGKFTLAELEEEEQGLDRMRRWYRELRGRDLLGTSGASDALTSLKECEARFEEYAERVYSAVGSPTQDE